MATPPPYKVKDMSLAAEGEKRIRWAAHSMPVLALLKEEFSKSKPFQGKTLAACLHVTKETAVLMEVLQAGGAKVVLCGSNPLSTQDDIAAALAAKGIHVYAWRGVNEKEYYECVDYALDQQPDITMDDGADLVTRLHTVKKEHLGKVLGGNEETTTGVTRFRAMAKDGVLKYPILAINDAKTKHLFDNRYGTGQSTIDGLLRATAMLVAGKTFTVAGYGWVGKGLAMRARGMGANVIVTEIDPIHAIEAAMDGFRVMPMAEAAAQSDVIVTVTGNKHVIDKNVIAKLKDGATLANSGHFDIEIDLKSLRAAAKEVKQPRPNVEEYKLSDGRTVFVVGEGRLVNLAAAEGHPAEVMDMSFANQALGAKWMLENHKQLKPEVYSMPEDLDRRVAALKLAGMGLKIDTLTEEQRKY
ncbi:MAG TPA: adenosylhomocysteinase, partial [Candidatus Thermoplasmatota archaeon]|nr:adenosylhomocysteinase [Candidatus Thermoplasmatota archaeon]